MIPLFHPPKQNVNRMIRELRDTLSGRWWGQGPKVDEFERMFSEKFGFKNCVMTNSGTAALHLAYVLAGIVPGDQVIVPVLTCTATCHPLKHLGAGIVFADINTDTLTQDPEDVFRRMGKWTKAVVLVHLGGLVDDFAVKEIVHVARECKTATIEDAAQALGADGLGRADFTCFSFQAIKGLSTGDGGMLVCKRKEDYARAKRLRWFGIDREEKIRKGWQAWDRRGITFDQEEPGYKFQPTDIDAAIGIAGLGDFDRNQKQRHSLVDEYRWLLKDSWVTLLDRGSSNADWLFMVKVAGNARDAFAERLALEGIETNVAHLRNDIFTVFGGKRLDLPGMNEIEKQYLCLPLNNAVTVKDVRRICKVIGDM